jgi:hypothetical protein
MRQYKGASDDLCEKYLRSEPNKKYSRCKCGPQCLLVQGSSFWHYIGTLIIAVVQSFRSYRSFHFSDRCICQVVLAIFRLFRFLQTKEIKKLIKEKRAEQSPLIVFCSRNRVLLILFDQAELEIYRTYPKEKRNSITVV